MKSPVLAVIAVTLSFASLAEASILSATSQAVREPSRETAGQWTATTLQDDLNATLRDAAEASAPAGPLASSRAPVEGGMVVTGRGTGALYTPFSGSGAFDGLFRGSNGGSSVTKGTWDPSGPVFSSNHGGRKGGRRDRDRDWDRRPGRRGRDRDRDRPNPYATPEPSTWLLIGSGLLALGAYSGLRRRDLFGF